MAGGGKTLVVLNDAFEAKKAIPYFKDSTILCLSLDAEFFVKDLMPNYQNPLHEIIQKHFKVGNRSYYWRNFKIAHTWYKEPTFKYVQDSFGYFLTEFERSLDLASIIINKFKPYRIVIGEPKDHRGFEIIHGNLDSTTISLIAREKGLPIMFLKSKKVKINFISILGKLIAKLRFLEIRNMNKSDLLLISPGRHLLQMKGLVSELERKASIILLTYGLDIPTRKKLKKSFPDLIEKENYINSKLKQKSIENLRIFENRKPWKNFVHPKYKNRKIINNFLQNTVRKIVEREFEPILVDIYLSEYLLNLIKPKTIITTTDPDTKVLPFINTAKKMGIKTIGLQHGADFTGVNPVYYAKSDYFIAWSKLAQHWSEKNIPGVKVLAGHSQFHTLKRITRRKSGRNLSVLYLSTINYYEREVPYFLLKLLESLEKQGHKITLTIRTHPSQSLENIKGLFTRKKIMIRWDNSRSLDDSISETDAVIFENTTAGLYAMLAQKPVIYFNPYDCDDYFALQKRGILTILNDSEIETKINLFFGERSKWNDFSKKGYKFAIEYLGLTKNKDAKLAKLIINSFQR